MIFCSRKFPGDQLALFIVWSFLILLKLCVSMNHILQLLCPFLATSYHLNFCFRWLMFRALLWMVRVIPTPMDSTGRVFLVFYGNLSSSFVTRCRHSTTAILTQQKEFPMHRKNDYTTASFPSSLAAYCNQGVWVPLHWYYWSRRSRSHHYLLRAASQWRGSISYRPLSCCRLPWPRVDI